VMEIGVLKPFKFSSVRFSFGRDTELCRDFRTHHRSHA
jgi:hypothetical protein